MNTRALTLLDWSNIRGQLRAAEINPSCYISWGCAVIGSGDEQRTAGAFSDRVIAIIITIMVLEMKVPHVGIYWNNHHHMLHACTVATGEMLWGNLHLLFWLSLFPFATGWMGQNHFTAVPTALYGVVLLMAAIAYYLLQQVIIRTQGNESILKKAVGRDWKGKLSLLLYVLAIITALRLAWVAQAIFVVAALIWLIPDRRVTNMLQHNHSS
jgi:uncharacterized membrane protein